MRNTMPKSLEELVKKQDHVIKNHYQDEVNNLEKSIKNNVPFLFREYEKYNEQFHATNKYFLSEEIDDGKVVFIGFDFSAIKDLKESEDNKWMIPFLKSLSNKKFIVEEIIPHASMKNIYYSLRGKTLYETSDMFSPINLITIQNISFSYDEHTLKQNDIIKRFFYNDQQIDDSFLEDTYYNESFSKKVQLNLPIEFKQELTIDVNKRYLFRVHSIEIDSELGKENYCLE